MKLLLSDLTDLGDLDLPAGVEVVPIDERAPVPPEHRDAEVVVCWGLNPDQAAFFADLPNLKWVQSFMAGPDRIMTAGLPPEVIVTNGANFHDLTVAEHTLALALANLRRIPDALTAMEEHRWARELGGVQPLRPKDRVTTLLGSHVVIWGFGAIGQQIARLFAACGANVVGIANRAGERAGFAVVGPEGRDDALRGADVLVMVLPHSSATQDVLNAETIALLPDRAQVVNVGRGSAIDEDALAAALREGRLGAAALDVTKIEPLPESSPLWDAPRLIITPHAAGGRPLGAQERLAHNVRAFLDGSELIGVMPR